MLRKLSPVCARPLVLKLAHQTRLGQDRRLRQWTYAHSHLPSLSPPITAQPTRRRQANPRQGAESLTTSDKLQRCALQRYVNQCFDFLAFLLKFGSNRFSLWASTVAMELVDPIVDIKIDLAMFFSSHSPNHIARCLSVCGGSKLAVDLTNSLIRQELTRTPIYVLWYVIFLPHFKPECHLFNHYTFIQ